MTASKALPRELRMLYRDIPPASGCVAGCSDCCGPVVWTHAEFARVAAEVPVNAAWVDVMGQRALINPLTGKCPFASTDGCRVYDRRPFLCRLFASVDDTQLRCPHGCKAAKPLTGRQGGALTDRYRQIEARDPPDWPANVQSKD